MAGVDHFPHFHARVRRSDSQRVPQRNYAVIGAVNQQDRSFRLSNNFLWGKPRQVKTVAHPGVQKPKFDNRPENAPSKPGLRVERLADVIIGGLAKVGECGFSGHRTEAGLLGETFEQLCSAHGLAQREDAFGVLIVPNPIDPSADVPSL